MTKREFIEALKGAIEERAAGDGARDADAVLDDVGTRMGVTLVRSTYEPPHVPAPIPEPDGFIYPIVPLRRMTARRRTTLISQLEAKRPETRRMAVAFLGRMLDDPVALDALKAASLGDPDPCVRGESMMCLGLATSGTVDAILDSALQLAREAIQVPAGTKGFDIARQGAAYGILGALLAAFRDARPGVAPILRSSVESLDPRPTSGHSNLPLRQRRSLLTLIAALERISLDVVSHPATSDIEPR